MLEMQLLWLNDVARILDQLSVMTEAPQVSLSVYLMIE